ncbi:MAG: GNAT family N-acetyltransferase [Acidimicrobiales bacterium]
MQIGQVDVDNLSEEELRAWFAADVAAHRADGDPAPAPAWREFCGRLQDDGWTDERPQWWLARHDDTPVGWLRVSLPTADNPHAAIGKVVVAPGCRRQGIGRQLAGVGADHARAAGRRVFIGECSDVTPGPAFCSAIGAEPGVRGVRRLLHLDRVPAPRHERLCEEAWQHAGGYSLVTWSGPAPDALAAEIPAVESSMNDAPVDALDYGDEHWDIGRLRRAERNAEDTGYRLHQVGVRHDATGDLAGLTRLAVSEENPSWAQQWGTVVVPAHRGHRLGLVVKLEMIRMLRGVEPALTTIQTDNAASNRYMIAVNELIGFEPADSVIAYQLRLE